MVFAIVGILVFMMKISAKEENTDKLLRENSDEDNEDSGNP